MTVTIRPSKARGHARHGWLESRHSFSFADYYDADQMGFRSLRVINEDIIDGGSGFPPHGHRDMEIISYVVAGALAHRDSTGSDGVIRRGDIQAMSAGTGVRHSEFNDSTEDKTHFLQIWIVPSANGLAPRYGEMSIPDAEKHNSLRLMVGPEAKPDTLQINQDAKLYGSLLQAGHSVEHSLAVGRAAWLQMVGGSVTLNGVTLEQGDGAAIEEADQLFITAEQDSEFLLFDLA
jgi:redox-sensitive bicupin YhaK (pirin superfamily)